MHSIQRVKGCQRTNHLSKAAGKQTFSKQIQNVLHYHIKVREVIIKKVTRQIKAMNLSDILNSCERAQSAKNRHPENERV